MRIPYKEMTIQKENLHHLVKSHTICNKVNKEDLRKARKTISLKNCKIKTKKAKSWRMRLFLNPNNLNLN